MATLDIGMTTTVVPALRNGDFVSANLCDIEFVDSAGAVTIDS